MTGFILAMLVCLTVSLLLAHAKIDRLEERLAEAQAFNPWRGEEKQDEPEPAAYSYFPETMPDTRKHPPNTVGAEEFYVDEQFGRRGTREYLEEMGEK